VKTAMALSGTGGIAEDLFTAEDRNKWQTILPASINVFGSVEFARIYQKHTNYAARLFVVESDDLLVAYPFFLRPINSLPFAAHVSETLWDTLTPEYSGPIVFRASQSLIETHFADRYAAYCKEQGIVVEFARLHPWSWRIELLDPSGVETNREIVYVDLTLYEQQLWQESFTHACRKNIRRAQRENVRVFQAKTPSDIREFHRIYTRTMDWNQALDQYYFPLEYFMAFFEQIPDNARFTIAEYKNQIVAGTLYLHDDINVYSYLGGADYTLQNVRPTNAVVYDTIRWAQQQGKKRLVLGGGYQPDDGIFRFKASFSSFRSNFYVYKRIHRDDVYASLCRAWCAYYRDDVRMSSYFPAYRTTPKEAGFR